MKRWIVVIGVVVMCGGCALYPRVPNITHADIEKHKHEADPLHIIDGKDALATVRAVQAVLALHANRKRLIQLSSDEVTHYAALAAVIGLQFDKAGAVNTGAGVATLGSIFGGRYRLPEQAAAIDAAIASLRCLETRLADINAFPPGSSHLQTTLQAHINSLDPAFVETQELSQQKNQLITMQNEAESELPRVTQWAIRRVLEDLRVAMAGLPLQSQSMGQLAKLFDDAKQSKEETRRNMNSFRLGSNGPVARGLVALSSFEEDAVLCVTTNAQ